MSTQNGHVLGIIPDGYTLPFFIAAEPEDKPVHCSVRGEYRPMTVTEAATAHWRQQRCLIERDYRKHELVAGNSIREHIVSWNLKDQHGQPIDKGDLTKVMQVQPTLFAKLYRLITGDWAGDPDPEDHSRRGMDDFMDRLEAEVDGKHPEEAEVKN